jgi:hypothetical protein
MFVVHADALRQIVQRGVQLDAFVCGKLHDDGAGAADRHHEDNGEPDQIPGLGPPVVERGGAVVLAVRLIGTWAGRALAINRSESSDTSRCPAAPPPDRCVIPSGKLRTKDFSMKESICG